MTKDVFDKPTGDVEPLLLGTSVKGRGALFQKYTYSVGSSMFTNIRYFEQINVYQYSRRSGLVKLINSGFWKNLEISHQGRHKRKTWENNEM